MKWLLLLALLAGCSFTPKPFVDGAEVPAPAGCQEARTRGVNC